MTVSGKRVGALVALVVASSLLGLLGATPARAAAPKTCHWDDSPNFGGTYYCKYGRHLYTFANGTKEGFVIGTDYAVWTRWVTAKGTKSDWVSLGGQITHDSTADGSTFKIVHCSVDPHDALYVGVVGTDDLWWSKFRPAAGDWFDWWQYDADC